MSKIQVLDCTLRDGGYCNEWKFGETNIRHIVDGLTEAKINIIECGFLNHKIEYKRNVTKFSNMGQIMPFIPQGERKSMYVLMANYGELDIDKLEPRSESTVDGLRIAFHKKDLNSALDLCKKVKEKGYEVFVQAMVSLNYTDEEFISLIKSSNEICPYAFYIVDSFGVMKQSDLIRLFYLVENNLDSSIKIGYHSHNNLQLAYSNAQALAEIQTTRDLIFDSSIMGMGRGAGNLNTELFVEFLNTTEGLSYSLKPVLKLIDEIINKFYQDNYWGYSLPNYLSAKHNIHPNYAKYLADKNTLAIADMDAIFDKIERYKSVNYDKSYIEKLYFDYMKKGRENNEKLSLFNDRIRGKKVLLIAPGTSCESEKETVISFAKNEGVVSISVNFDYKTVNTDYTFVSNIRRYNELDSLDKNNLIITSNISEEECFIKVNYADLLNGRDRVSDNAGLMLIKLLIDLGVTEIYLAGFDGYSYEKDNYAEPEMNLTYRKEDSIKLNEEMSKVLMEYSKEVKINFLTTKKFLAI